MMHDDGTASDVTIGVWRDNQQATNHERNDNPEWYYKNMYKWCHETRRNHPLLNLNATKVSKLGVFASDTWPWRFPKNDGKRAVV